MIATPHFDSTEFDCHDGTAYPPEWIEDRLLVLCSQLEIIREACNGRRVSITSGYRSEAHNLKIGGAKHSQHMLGRAADIEVEGLAPSDVHHTILGLYGGGRLLSLGGLGVYPGWNHVDVRIGGTHLCQWMGGGIGSEVAG